MRYSRKSRKQSPKLKMPGVQKNGETVGWRCNERTATVTDEARRGVLNCKLVPSERSRWSEKSGGTREEEEEEGLEIMMRRSSGGGGGG
jgi:hypothetical protein